MEAYGAGYAPSGVSQRSNRMTWLAHPYVRENRQGGQHVGSRLPSRSNVLVKELQALALDVRLLEEDEKN